VPEHRLKDAQREACYGQDHCGSKFASGGIASSMQFPPSLGNVSPGAARRDKWDRRFLALAEQVASWSKDPKVQVGAVLADDRNRVVGIGYNGFPDKFPDYAAMLATKAKHLAMIHAELNAILNCPVPTHGLTLYCTHSPCGPCQPMIVQAGIKRLVCPWPDAAWQAKHPLGPVLHVIETRFVARHGALDQRVDEEKYDADATYGH
jgi:dCMP deaminase